MTDALPGKLIAIEGLDGSGKSTQCHLLQRWLASRGLRVFYSLWESSDLVRGVTRRGKKRQLYTPSTFSLVYATDFADRYERQILPMLKAGFIVVANRYIFTSFARDRVRGCDPAWLRELYGFAHVPDLTLFLNMPLHVALNRASATRHRLSYFEAGMDLGLSQDIQESFHLYQSRLMEQYLLMAEEWEFAMIDGTRTIYEQQESIRHLVNERLELRAFKDGEDHVAMA